MQNRTKYLLVFAPKVVIKKRSHKRYDAYFLRVWLNNLSVCFCNVFNFRDIECHNQKIFLTFRRDLLNLAFIQFGFNVAKFYSAELSHLIFCVWLWHCNWLLTTREKGELNQIRILKGFLVIMQKFCILHTICKTAE